MEAALISWFINCFSFYVLVTYWVQSSLLPMQLKQAVSRDSENHPVRKVVVQQELIVSLLMREKMWIKNLALIIMQTSFSKWSHGGFATNIGAIKSLINLPVKNAFEVPLLV